MNRKNRLVGLILAIAVVMSVAVVSASAATYSKSYQLYTNMGAAEVSTAYKTATAAKASATNASSSTTNTTIILRRAVGGSVTKAASAIATPGSTSTTARCTYSGSSDATWAAVAAPSAKLGAGTYFCSGTLKLITG